MPSGALFSSIVFPPLAIPLPQSFSAFPSSSVVLPPLPWLKARHPPTLKVPLILTNISMSRKVNKRSVLVPRLYSQKPVETIVVSRFPALIYLGMPNFLPVARAALLAYTRFFFQFSIHRSPVTDDTFLPGMISYTCLRPSAQQLCPVHTNCAPRPHHYSQLCCPKFIHPTAPTHRQPVLSCVLEVGLLTASLSVPGSPLPLLLQPPNLLVPLG